MSPEVLLQRYTKILEAQMAMSVTATKTLLLNVQESQTTNITTEASVIIIFNHNFSTAYSQPMQILQYFWSFHFCYSTLNKTQKLVSCVHFCSINLVFSVYHKHNSKELWSGD